MSIDKASIYAERYKSNPQVLTQAVLGQGGPGAPDPYSALRALQLIKESQQAQMAQQAQGNSQEQPSLASQAIESSQQSQGLAGMPVPEQSYARGGIVAFNGEGTEGQVTYSGGYGLPANHPFVKMISDNAEEIRKAEYKGVTSQEYDKAIEDRQKLLSGLFGENKAATALSSRLKEDDEARAGTLEQGKGMALLQAAAAMAQGNNFVRGLGNAGGAFASAYGDALKLDKAEKRAINRSQFDLADSLRKEKLGIIGDSIKAADQLGVSRREEFRSQLEKFKALANLGAAGAKAVGKSGGSGGGPKDFVVGPEVYLAQIKEEHKDWSPAKQKAEAFKRFQQGKAAGYQGAAEKTAVAAEGNEIKRTEQETKALGDLRVTKQYKKATPEQQKQMEADEIARIAKMPVANNLNSNSGDNVVPPPPPGFKQR